MRNTFDPNNVHLRLVLTVLLTIPQCHSPLPLRVLLVTYLKIRQRLLKLETNACSCKCTAKISVDFYSKIFHKKSHRNWQPAVSPFPFIFRGARDYFQESGTIRYACMYCFSHIGIFTRFTDITYSNYGYP